MIIAKSVRGTVNIFPQSVHTSTLSNHARPPTSINLKCGCSAFNKATNDYVDSKAFRTQEGFLGTINNSDSKLERANEALDSSKSMPGIVLQTTNVASRKAFLDSENAIDEFRIESLLNSSEDKNNQVCVTTTLDSGVSESGGCSSRLHLPESKEEGFSWFPYTHSFKVGSTTVSSSDIIQYLDPYIVETRKKRISEVVKNRTYSVCIVVEGLADSGNISAVFRTAEALGFQSVHIISNENSKRYKRNRNVSMGSEKWLDIEQWKSTYECFRELHARGYRVVVADVGTDAVHVNDMDWTQPTAIVLGNELNGITSEAVELSDIKCCIPMIGMVDSFNVSVAAGIFMHTAMNKRISSLGMHGDLKSQECQILTAEFYRRQRHAVDILKHVTKNETFLPENFANLE